MLRPARFFRPFAALLLACPLAFTGCSSAAESSDGGDVDPSRHDAAADGHGTDTGADSPADSPVDGTISDSAPPETGPLDAHGLDTGATDGTASDGPIDSPTEDSGEAGTLTPAACTSVCSAGQKLCNEQCVSVDDPSYGCGADTCGTCISELSCPGSCTPGLAVTSVTCTAGACAVASCPTGWADCDGVFSNGCEADLSSEATCGTCGHACSGSELCAAGTCVSTCPFPEQNCSSACRDVYTDPNACGACTSSCPLEVFSEQSACSQPDGAAQPSCGALTCAAGATLLSCASTGTNFCWQTNDPVGPCPCQSCLPGNVCSGGQCVAICPAGHPTCASGCTDPMSDPANCGGCGQACAAGGVCASGHCFASATSLELVTGLSVPVGLAVDATNLYVSDSGTNTVWQVNKTTLAKTSLATNQAGPSDVVTDGTYVYWLSTNGTAVLRAPIGGATPFQDLYTTTGKPSQLAVDATSVYWQDTNGINAAPVGGGGTVRVVLAASSTATQTTVTISSLTQDQDYLYGIFTGAQNSQYYSNVGRVDKATGALTNFGHIEGGATAQGIFSAGAVDSSNFYYLYTGSIGYTQVLGEPQTVPVLTLDRQAKSGGPVLSDALSSASFSAITSMAADDCVVYWATGTTIVRAAPGGAAPNVLTTSAVTPGKLALDASYVYWVDKGWIGQIAR